MRYTNHVAVFLCLLLVFNDFGPAHLKRLGRQNLKAAQPKPGKFGSFVAKLSTGAEIVDGIVSLGSIAVTFFNSIDQCCSVSKACQYTMEAKDLQVKLEKTREEIRSTILCAQNLEETIDSAQREFGFTVHQMNQIGQASGTLLMSLNSTLRKDLKILDNRLVDVVSKEAALNKTVKYVDLETQYFNVLDGVLGIAVPLFTTIIPAIPKVNLWAKARMGRYKVYELDPTPESKTIQAPSRGDPKYKAGNSWFGKQAAKITYKVDSVNTKLKIRYDKAFKVVENFQKGIKASVSLIKTAFNIYSIFKEFQKCDKAETEAKKALDKLKEAEEELNLLLNNAKLAKNNMTAAGEKLKEQLTSEILLNDLTELKVSLQSLTSLTGEAEFGGIIKAIEGYVGGITADDQDYLDTYNMINELREGLVLLPSYFKCYTEKATIVRTVYEKCQEGENTLERLLDSASILDSEDCQTRVKMDEFTVDQLQSLIDKKAEENGFNRNCVLNSKHLRNNICREFCGLAKNKDEFEYDVDTVSEILEGCTPCKVEGSLKKTICRVKGKMAATEILGFLASKKDLELRGYTVATIENLDCSN